MFGLSYHINSADSIACYWTSQGSGFRFFEKDMRDIWPHYFVEIPQNRCYKHSSNNDNKNEYKNCMDCGNDNDGDDHKQKMKNQKTKNTNFVEFIDKPFREFYEKTTGKKDLYSKNNKNNKNIKKKQVKKDLIVFNEFEQDLDLSSMDNLINTIAKLQSSGWSKEVKIIIPYIQECFDGADLPTDVIVDLKEGVVGNSEILEHLEENLKIDQFKQRADLFVDELLKLFSSN